MAASVSLLVPAAGDVGVRQLVDDTQRRLAAQDRLEVHLLEHHSAIRLLSPRDDFEIRDAGLGIGAAVALDEADDDVDALAAEGVRILDHRVRLADARRRADIDAQPRALQRLNLRRPLLAGGRAFSTIGPS
jgi:hypothetical protein